MRTIPFFVAHDSNQRRQLSALPRLSPHGDLFAGAVARIAVGLVLNPVTLVKAQFESNLHPRRTLTASLQHIIQTYGKRGLLLGFGASVLRDAPYSGIFVLSYELIKREAAHMPFVSIPIALALSSGAAATISTVLTQPFDVAKTNMQLRPTHYSGVWQTLVLLGQERGLKGYFDGLLFRTAKKGLSSATLWAVYETSLRYLLAE